MKETSFMKNPGSDWVALDIKGNVLSRGASEGAVKRAVPHAHEHRPIKGATPNQKKAPSSPKEKQLSGRRKEDEGNNGFFGKNPRRG